MSVFKAGLALGFGLIISMGPQNIFLIRQGLRREYAYVAALVCALCDTILIILSTMSISKLILTYPTAKTVMIGIGVAFLVGYGIKSIYSGLKGYIDNRSIDFQCSSNKLSLITILLTAVSFSLINPQAIIDTMIMIGGVVNQYPQEDQSMFIIGVIIASFLWFSGLVTLSSLCAHYFNSRKTWSVLEIASGLIMLCFSYLLLVS